MPTGPRSALWRADLARLLAAGGGELAAQAAGFAWEGPREPVVSGGSVEPLLEAALPARADRQPLDLTDRGGSVPFLLLTEVSYPAGVEQVVRNEPVGLTADDLRFVPDALRACPPGEAVTTWSRLGPRLRRVLCSGQTSRRLDLRRLVRRLARAEVVASLPRRLWRGWPRRLHLWVDRADRLATMAPDQQLVQHALCGQLGSRLTVRELAESGKRSAITRTGLVAPLPASLTGQTVLLLGDAAGAPVEQAAWRRTAAALAARQARLVVLRPGADPTPAGVRSLPWRRELALTPEARARRVERLLRLLSPADLVQPGLLRALRLLLPPDEADEGTEIDAMTHPDVLAADETALVLRRSKVGAYRDTFVELEPPELRREVGRRIARWHTELPVEVRHTETLAWVARDADVAPPGDAAEARGWLNRLVGQLEQAQASGGRATSLRVLGRAVAGALPDHAYHHDTLGSTLTRLWALSHEGRAGVRVPEGVSAAEITAALGPTSTSPTRWVVVQHGAALRFDPDPADGNVPDRPPLAWVRSNGLAFVSVGGQRHTVPLRPGVRVPLGGVSEVSVETEVERVVLTPWTLPPWAIATGRDRWGVWADVEIAGVVQRFRWIPPGRFLMGSPDGEVGRYEREGPQHLVTLTQGFWLGDTPVTQELWQAVTGEAPSRFVGPRRPVERVSWEECVAFTAAVAKLAHAELPVPRLPTEAEWEYACRAGTTGATWRGELELRRERDAPLLDEIGWYGGNSGHNYPYTDGRDSSGWPGRQYPHRRAGTREVATRQPQPWGLHDMLGNVYEWCEDHWDDGPYERGGVVNPFNERGSNRVVRGGSWLSFARYVRAAYRGGGHAGSRGVDLGFRLALGPRPASPAPQPGAAVPGPEAADPPRAAPTRDASKQARGGRRRGDEP